MYTIKPSEKFAKAYGRNLRISNKDAVKLCKVIRKKPLDRAKRLLNDLYSGKRNLERKYYTKAVGEMLAMINSCEKNADFLGLDKEKLIVHASAHTGPIIRRRRRKAAFGSRMKSTNLEIMLIEKGKQRKEAEKKMKQITKPAIEKKSQVQTGEKK